MQKVFLKHHCTLWWMIEFFSTHMWFKYGSCGWRANHQPICGHRTLSFSCGRNTTKPEAEKERGACYPWGPRSYQSLCHNDSPCNWSVDAESTGQLWQSALCMCVCILWVCVRVHLHSVPRCRGLSLFIPCSRMEKHACRRCACGQSLLMKWHAGRSTAKGIMGLGMQDSNMLPQQQSMRLCPSERERQERRKQVKVEQLP